MRCICGSITAVDNKTPVVVVQHHRERQHPFGTARLARLGLTDCTVHVAERGQVADGGSRCDAPVPPDAVLLYPSDDAEPLEERAAPGALVILDGTWPSSRALLRANEWIAALPRVTLRRGAPGRYRIRRAPHPEFQLSTIEAIVRALLVLEPDTPGLDRLLGSFEAMIDQQIELRARLGRPLSDLPSRPRGGAG